MSIKNKWHVRPGMPSTRPKSKLPATILATVISCACLSTVQADDTEVFFGQVDRNKNNQPNVLFVLDTSGSMNYFDGQDKSRLTRMKDAMNTILSQSDNVNVGLMRFNGGSGGGAVLYPVTAIDEPVCESNDCGEVKVLTQMAAGDDDAEEYSNGSMSLGGNILSLEPAASEADEREIGLRFRGVNIPQGATITSASIEFTSQSNSNPTASELIAISSELSDDAPTYTSSNRSVSSRNYSRPAYWKPGEWKSDRVYSTTDISEQVQAVVDRAGWCGGSSMAFELTGSASRDIHSYNADPSEAPVLRVSYDSTSIPEGAGCTVRYAVSRIGGGTNDAEESNRSKTNTGSSDLELFADRGVSQYIGLRFTNIQVPKGANIRNAYIEFEMDEKSTGASSGIIYGEKAQFPQSYKKRKRNISGRTRTLATMPWPNLPSRSTNQKLLTPNISNIVRELTNESYWKSGNNMAFVLNNQSTRGRRTVESYDGEPAAAPRLVIEYESTVQPSTEEPTYITARDRLLTEIAGMTATGGTPIVDAYYEAAQYFLGGPVGYGTDRGRYTSKYHRVSHPLSYIGGTVQRREECTDANLNSHYCSDETIEGNPQYISPMATSCQTNHIVLLSDGAATSNSAVEKIEQLTGLTCDATGRTDERCGTQFADWLATEDHAPTLSEEQTISTYTIGFNTNQVFLKSIANNGNGRYFRANSASELVDRFQDILSDVYSTDTSFVAPGATVNQFNRLTHRDDIYFALFKPQERPTWSGNLKKYQVGLKQDGVVTIFDHSNPKKDAVDAEQGFFADNAKSDWSSMTDGSNVALGGAAEVLQDHSIAGTGLDRRHLYTYVGDTSSIASGGIDIVNDGQLLHESITAITDAHLELSGTEGNVDSVRIDRTNLLRWARGIDVKDEDGDGDSDEIRGHMGDPMHSRPVIMNYVNASDSESPYTTIFIGTNEGILHGVNNTDGKEIFSFMPKELLPNIQKNFVNSTATQHPYGLDGTMSTWTIDKNNNVMIDPGEDAMLYVGMRRGGSNYYAFDVSNRTQPKLKWMIKGGAGGTKGFEQLGQSWSKMVPTRIRYKNEVRSVLIFGGGYDLGNDVDYSIGILPKTEDLVGRAIYIVDAFTGELIYSVGNGSDGDPSFPRDKMKYAIPSDIRVLDIDGNGFADAMFVGDMGGQVWRFDFDLYHSSGDLLDGNVIASLGSTSTISVANTRRFFYEPDIALMRENGQRYLSIGLGSGWRSHPLNTDVNDAFFMLRSYDIYTKPDGYGKQTSAGSYEPITTADLTDVTTELSPAVGEHGWMMNFNQPGEKVLGDALTVNGQIVFTSYQPESSANSCSSALGTGKVYAMRVADGKPSLDLNDDGRKSSSDRGLSLNHAGVPPDPTALIVEGEVLETDGSLSTVIKPALLVGPEQPLEGIFDNNLTKREFWLDAGMTKKGARGATITPAQSNDSQSTTTAETTTQ